jgi:hypothetical protein
MPVEPLISFGVHFAGLLQDGSMENLWQKPAGYKKGTRGGQKGDIHL